MPELSELFAISTWVTATVLIIAGISLLTFNRSYRPAIYFFLLTILLSMILIIEGLLVSATTIQKLFIPSFILAILVPLTMFLFLTISYHLFYSTQTRYWRFAYIAGYFLLVLFVLLIIVDTNTGSKVWFSGVDEIGFPGSLIPINKYISGEWANILIPVFFTSPGILLLYFLTVGIISSKNHNQGLRKYYFLLFVSISAWMLSTLNVIDISVSPFFYIATILFLFLSFFGSYLKKLASDNPPRTGTLFGRSLTLCIVITLSLFACSLLIIQYQTKSAIKNDALSQIKKHNQEVSRKVSQWVDNNVTLITNLATSKEIISMQAAIQTSYIKQTILINPQIYSISVIDISGNPYTSNKNKPTANQKNKQWFHKTIEINSTIIDFDNDDVSNTPLILITSPIKNQKSETVGLIYITYDINNLIDQIQPIPNADNEISYIIDDSYKILAISDSIVGEPGQNISERPIMDYLKNNKPDGIFSYIEHDFQTWYACINKIDNGWGIVTQIPEKQIFINYRKLETSALLIFLISSVIIIFFVSLITYLNLKPLNNLIQNASRFTEGNIKYDGLLKGNDEISKLSCSFLNSTTQMRELIHTLENKNKTQTGENEYILIQLQLLQDIAKAAVLGIDQNQLCNYITQLVSTKLNFSEVSIYLLDDGGDFLTLQATTNKDMDINISPSQKIIIHDKNIIGYVASYGQPKILSVNNQEINLTQNEGDLKILSEIAIPLFIQNHLFGVFDIKFEDNTSFFGDQLVLLQPLAEQIALALNQVRSPDDLRQSYTNAQVYNKSKYRYTPKEFTDLSQEKAYAYEQNNIHPADNDDSTIIDSSDSHNLVVPIQHHDQVIGSLFLERDPDQPIWTDEEILLTQAIVRQTALAIINSTLREQNNQRAVMDNFLNQFSTEIQKSLDLETILKKATGEIGKNFNATKTRITLNTEISNN